MYYPALVLDGKRDYVSVPDNPSLRISSYTVELWIKPQGTPGSSWQGIIGKPGRNFNIWLYKTGYIHHRFHTNRTTNDGAPNTDAGVIQWNQWNHVAITNDGVTAKTYVNGNVEKQGRPNGRLVVDNRPLIVGRSLDDQNREYFQGQIAEVRIWNIVRTESEIRSNKNRYLTGNEKGLTLYWNFSNNSLNDHSPNNNTGQRFDNAHITTVNDLPMAGTSLNLHTYHFLTPPERRTSSTATFKKAEAEASVSYEPEDKPTEMVIDSKDMTYDRILQIELVKNGTFVKNANIVLDINVGLKYKEGTFPTNPEAKDGSMSFMLSDGDNGIGIEIRSPKFFTEYGPYRGIEADLRRGKIRDDEIGYIPDATGEFTSLEYLDKDIDQSRIPEVFKISLKPQDAWGRCYSAIEGGHTVSVGPYFRELDLSRDLYLNVYGNRTREMKSYYSIKYVEAILYAE